MQKYIKSKPIFVVGAHRSATSHIKKSVCKGFAIPGNTEGYVWSILNKIHQNINHIITEILQGEDSGIGDDFSIKAFGPQRIFEEVIETIDKIHQTEFNSKLWVDKSPGHEMLKTLPYLSKYFPDCKIIYCNRDTIQNLQSRAIRFPKSSFQYEAQSYARAINAWIGSKEKLIQPFLIVNQSELKSNPKIVAESIADYLGEKMNPNFLDLLKGNTEKTNRPELSSQEIFDRWNIHEKFHFFENCYTISNSPLEFRNLYVVNDNEWSNSNWEGPFNAINIHPNKGDNITMIFPNFQSHFKSSKVEMTIIPNKDVQKRLDNQVYLELKAGNYLKQEKVNVINRGLEYKVMLELNHGINNLLKVSCKSLYSDISYSGCKISFKEV